MFWYRNVPLGGPIQNGRSLDVLTVVEAVAAVCVTLCRPDMFVVLHDRRFLCSLGSTAALLQHKTADIL
jgi:hypothetical protein